MIDYKVLACRFSTESKAVHQLLVKEHKVRHHTEDKPPNRTLLVLHVPPFATEDSFKHLFSVVGPVQSVNFYDDFQDLQNKTSKLGFKVAFVVFEKPSGLLKALKLEALEPLSTSEQPILMGMQKWIKQYNDSCGNEMKLRTHCVRTIAKYDKEGTLAGNTKNIVDDEGWTVVTKKSRDSALSKTENLQEKLTKKRLKNFYTFQIKESKMNRVAQLRKKLEEDKKRLEAFKKSRKFRPT